MNVLDALASRRSIRVFRPDPVPRDVLERILGAATQAPSWANTQSWEIFAATGQPLERLRAAYLERFDAGVTPSPDIPALPAWSDAAKERTGELLAARSALLGLDMSRPEGRREFSLPNYRFYGAPVVVFLGFARGLVPWALYDLGALAQSLMLAAQEFGVDSIPSFSLALYPDLIRREIEIPEEVDIALGVALGYRDEGQLLNSFRSTRRPFNEVVRMAGF